MKRKSYIIFLVVSLFILACGGIGVAQETPTPQPSNTPEATLTATVRPTSTRRPTSTPIPSTPTAVQMGETVVNDKYEVAVIHTRRLETVYIDELYQWVANPGYQFLELGVKVKNLTNSPTSVQWNWIYIIDAEGNWYPGWGAFKAVSSGVDVNPKSLVFAEIKSPNSVIAFDDTAFFRLIWTTSKTNPDGVLFGFDDSQLIQVKLQ